VYAASSRFPHVNAADVRMKIFSKIALIAAFFVKQLKMQVTMLSRNRAK